MSGGYPGRSRHITSEQPAINDNRQRARYFQLESDIGSPGTGQG